MSDNENAVEAPPEADNSPSKYSVVGIRFKPCGKIYTFDADALELTQGTKVVVESDMGLSLGIVATPKQTREFAGDPPKKVVRIATEADFETSRENQSLLDEARGYCNERAEELKLEMKVVKTETTLDKKRLTFYFTSDGRVDFRELVRDLAGKFKSRIEMRQIGVRDEVKLLGGLGVCGRQTCCNLFLTSFAPITIKMAKQQDLSINQSKLSGVCGRLMCCLAYEYNEHQGDRPSHRRRERAGGPARAKTELKKSESESLPVEQTPAAPRTAEVPEKSGDRESREQKQSGEKPGAETPADGKQRFKRKRRRSRKSRTDRPAVDKKADTAPAKTDTAPEKTAAAPKDDSGQKEKKKPFKRRRRFRKKKTPSDAKE